MANPTVPANTSISSFMKQNNLSFIFAKQKNEPVPPTLVFFYLREIFFIIPEDDSRLFKKHGELYRLCNRYDVANARVWHNTGLFIEPCFMLGFRNLEDKNEVISLLELR
jgi:hypothetical protein